MMIDTRTSTSGKYVFDIRIDPIEKLAAKYHFAAKVIEIRQGGKVIKAPSQLHEHHGVKPPEAADKAFAEADAAMGRISN